MTRQLNTPVTVLSMGFGRDLRAIPRRVEFEGNAIDFIDNGLRTTIKHGEKIAQVFALSDGNRTFHLRSDNHGGSWTLLSIG
ncbi:MAG: hypothetical protein WAW80_00280 [Candidatus Saccharimonadales bacterium]